jgi:hypothetical protein
VSDLARRGFLRGLTTLPLIGGGVTLIGNPTAAAEPISEQLLDSYDNWLFFERMTLHRERYGRTDGMKFVRMCDGFVGFVDGMDRGQSSASNRAAVVLSAVGCPWREGGR